MRSLTKGSLKDSFNTIRHNRGRSLLTMTGIIVGVAATIVIVSIGEGVKQQIQGQVSQLGKDLIMVRPGRSGSGSPISSSTSVAAGFRASEPLSDVDLKAITSSSRVKSATPLGVVDGTVHVDDADSPFAGTVIGTTPDLPAALHRSVAFGEFFGAGQQSSATMAVVGKSVAEDVFGEDVPLGRSFSFRGETFIVVGVLPQFDTVPLSTEADFNNTIFIPYATAKSLTKNSLGIYEVIVRPSDPNQLDATVQSVSAKLAATHGGQQQFSVLKQGQALAVSGSILDLLTAFIIGAAAVSLLLGGIGIMNIMLVSVTERMQEIGIRKAVGATNRQILGQFMTEATLLSLGGCLIGIIISILSVVLIRILTTVQPVIPWQIVVASALLSLVVGILFGSVPALKAARKDPITALRNE